ncbi:MAG: NnrS family protein [Candidatus Omnitrophica bacterium]|nr:NnrS family protein [Candidatus Omnitrophota bacterium]
MMSRLPQACDAFCREPYRLFFPLGVLAGLLGIGHWFAFGFALSDSYSGMFHSTVQVLVYMNCFIAGFLLTALPRFTQTPHASRGELVGFLLIMGAILFCAFHAWWIIADALFAVWLMWLVVYVLKRIKNRPPASSGSGRPPIELVWIPFGVVNGFTGTVLHIVGQLGGPHWALSVGKPLMDQGFLLSVVIGVGGFLIPRLMGTYAPQAVDRDKPTNADPATSSASLPTPALHMAYAAALFVSFWMEGLGAPSLGYGLRAAVVTAAFAASRALPRLPKVNELYVKMAYTSVWLTAAGYWGAALLPDFQKEMLHITFIGGFSLMTFSVASMVILTHAGAIELLRKPLWVLWTVAAGLTIALAERFLAVIFADQYFRWLGYSSACWMLAAIIWLLFMAKYFMTVPPTDEFGRMHQASKTRMKSC